MNFLKKMYGESDQNIKVKKEKPTFDKSKNIKEKLKEMIFNKKIKNELKSLNFSVNRLDSLSKKLHNKLNEIIKTKY